MYRFAGLLLLMLAVACSSGKVEQMSDSGMSTAKKASTGMAQRQSGIDSQNFDTGVKPQEDFYRYVNGTWLDNTEIPADKSNYGSFTVLYDNAQIHLKEIIEAAGNSKDASAGSDQQKIGDLYKSFMDTVTIAKLGLAPVKADLAALDAIQSRADLIRVAGEYTQHGIKLPFVFYVSQDAKQSEQYIAYVSQAGLGLPDKSYYFSEGEKFDQVRSAYLAYIEKLFVLAGSEGGVEKAQKIMALETALAEHHWDRAKNRNRDLTYNKYSVAELDAKMPHFDWNGYLGAMGATAATEIVVRQPDYFEKMDAIYGETPLDTWKAYFTFHMLSSAAPYLSDDFVDANFDFQGRTLAGIEQIRPRWKRAIGVVEGALGETVGRLYVAKYFKPEAKARMVDLVSNVRATFGERINGLDWMSAETKTAAVEKLGKFNTKIGYPDKWKDYSGLVIRKDDLIGNLKRSNTFDYQEMLGKLGKPIDRDEWFMTPQTVNAYYSSTMNEIVFPAAILQPPFFNLAADDAVNYGAIGAVIGHELTHGFDDQGRKSDGDGNLRDWWQESDGEAFKQRAQVMVDQYNTFSPIDSMNVNGELTLGENIADLGGLTIAYYAYQRSLKGKPAPVIDGLTGEQRFFMGWAQVWRRKYRENEMRRRLLTDPHSPSQYRVIGVLANMPEFHRAFEVKAGDPMFIAENERVKIW
ncbi:MAG TPA: M13-type metalloendopeptidase [Calditrichia bacterium]|nr:peptidase M13 [Calditrichota bacterium]HQV32056.1 M13-type metalloendopeptidase [Calditrichia bacterium]